MTKRPNFLFIMTDQQRADWLGCYGHPVVQTPHIDALAARGTRYTDFHAASPVCMPNRASFLTGRYPSLHGLRSNGCRLSRDARTFVDLLAEAGYDTAAIGKSHLQPLTGLPPMGKSFDEIATTQEAWARDNRRYNCEDPASYKSAGRFPIDLPYYGYRHVDMVTGHGDKCSGHYGQWFREHAPNWQALHDPANQLPHDYSCPQAYRTPVPEELYPTAYVKDRAIDYLAQRSPETPFFAFVSFPDPHHPFNPPGKYWDMYQPEQFDLPLPYIAHQNPTPPMTWLHKTWKNGGGQMTPQTAMMLDDPKLREAMALTAGMITCIDDAVGEILAALKIHGLDDNTVICFNADHGDYMGDFNMLLKGALPFRAITRVPMIWAEPGQTTARTTDQLASTIDLAPTILNRAGLEPFNGMQGQNLHSDTRRNECLIEYNDGGKRLGFSAPARMRALVTKDWRYTLYKDQDWGELYNLGTDPNETHNLWDDPAHQTTRAHLSERLNHHLIAQMDESPLATHIA